MHEGAVMGIHFNHKSKAGDRKMEKQLKLKMKADERKKKREEKENLQRNNNRGHYRIF